VKVAVSAEALEWAVQVAEFVELNVRRTRSVGAYCLLVGLLVGYERARLDLETRELV
jgi:hypothetical protein